MLGVGDGVSVGVAVGDNVGLGDTVGVGAAVAVAVSVGETVGAGVVAVQAARVKITRANNILKTFLRIVNLINS